MYIYSFQLISLPFLMKLGVMFLLGLLPYIYLPLSAHFSNARWTWGDQRTFSGFLKHLLRSEYGTFDLVIIPHCKQSSGANRNYHLIYLTAYLYVVVFINLANITPAEPSMDFGETFIWRFGIICRCAVNNKYCQP